MSSARVNGRLADVISWCEKHISPITHMHFMSTYGSGWGITRRVYTGDFAEFEVEVQDEQLMTLLLLQFGVAR